jgi:hypothetical protein
MYAHSGNLDQFTDDFLKSDEFFLRVKIQDFHRAELVIARGVSGLPRHDRGVATFFLRSSGNKGSGVEQTGQKLVNLDNEFLDGAVPYRGNARDHRELFGGESYLLDRGA